MLLQRVRQWQEDDADAEIGQPVGTCRDSAALAALVTGEHLMHNALGRFCQRAIWRLTGGGKWQWDILVRAGASPREDSADARGVVVLHRGVSGGARGGTRGGAVLTGDVNCTSAGNSQGTGPMPAPKLMTKNTTEKTANGEVQTCPGLVSAAQT